MCDFEDQPRDPDFKDDHEQEVIDSQHEDSINENSQSEAWNNSQGEIEALEDSTANESEWGEETEGGIQEENQEWMEEQHITLEDGNQREEETEGDHNEQHEHRDEDEHQTLMLTEQSLGLDDSKQQYIVVKDGNGDEQVYAVVRHFEEGMQPMEINGEMGIYEIHNGQMKLEAGGQGEIEEGQTMVEEGHDEIQEGHRVMEEGHGEMEEGHGAVQGHGVMVRVTREDSEQVEWLEEGATSDDGSQAQDDIETTLTALHRTEPTNQIQHHVIPANGTNSTDDLLKLLGGDEKQNVQNIRIQNRDERMKKSNIKMSWRESPKRPQSRPMKRAYENVRVTSGLHSPVAEKVHIKIRHAPAPDRPQKIVTKPAPTSSAKAPTIVTKTVPKTYGYYPKYNNFNEEDTALWDSNNEDNSSSDESDAFLDSLSSSSEDEFDGFTLDIRKEVASQLLPVLGRDAFSLLNIQTKQLQPLLETVISDRSKVKAQLKEASKEIKRLQNEISAIDKQLNSD